MNRGGALSGVDGSGVVLMDDARRYKATPNFPYSPARIDGPADPALFTVVEPVQAARQVQIDVDLPRVPRSQTTPDAVRVSSLAAAADWIDVDPDSLCRRTQHSIRSLGDVVTAPEARPAAARVQAPIVAGNLVAGIRGRAAVSQYDGDGSCPLTEERGKIMLVEFDRGGTLLPGTPCLLRDAVTPTRLARWLMRRILPPVYWRDMLRGQEWLAKPDPIAAK